jgi:hypothetical protein
MTFPCVSYCHSSEKQNASFQETIQETKNIKAETVIVQTKIDETNKVRDLLNRGSFPYNRFLYFVSTQISPDMKIVSIEKLSLEDETVEDPSETTTDGQTPTPTTEPPQEISPLPGVSTPASSEPTGELTQAENELELTDKSDVVNATSPFLDETTLFIKGYSVYPDSIAYFADKLRKESYIDHVQVTKVDNYYTGIQDLKLFEIKVTYK